MNRLSAGVLIALLAGGCQSMGQGKVTTRECPPQMQRTATTEPSTHLAAGGMGVAPREVTDSAGTGNFASRPGDTRLISAGGANPPWSIRLLRPPAQRRQCPNASLPEAAASRLAPSATDPPGVTVDVRGDGGEAIVA